MKSYFKMLIKTIPLALGIIFALLSISYTVKIVGGADEDTLFSAIFFGIFGYPLLITSALSLINGSNNDK